MSFPYVAGFVAAFLGVGGGLVLVPVLMIALRYPIKRAVGTSLATVLASALVAVATELVIGGSNIQWGVGLTLIAGAGLGTWAGGRILRRVADAPLRALFVAYLLVAALRMLAGAGPDLAAVTLTGASGHLASVGVGALAGTTSVLFGVGGGTVIVPALGLLFGEIPFHAARATSLLTIVPTAALGVWQHAQLGTIDVPAARRLIPSTLIGSVLGVVTVNLVPEAPCRTAFAVFLLLVAARLIGAFVVGRRRVPDSRAPSVGATESVRRAG